MDLQRVAGLAIVALSVVAACSVIGRRPEAPAAPAATVLVAAPLTSPASGATGASTAIATLQSTATSAVTATATATSEPATPTPTTTRASATPTATPRGTATPRPTATLSATPTQAPAVVALAQGDSGKIISVKPGSRVVLDLPAARKWSTPDVNPSVLVPEASSGSRFSYTARAAGTSIIYTVGVCKPEPNQPCDGQILNYKVTVVVG